MGCYTSKKKAVLTKQADVKLEIGNCENEYIAPKDDIKFKLRALVKSQYNLNTPPLKVLNKGDDYLYKPKLSVSTAAKNNQSGSTAKMLCVYNQGIKKFQLVPQLQDITQSSLLQRRRQSHANNKSSF